MSGKSNLPLKNLIENIQRSDAEYKIALPQFNQVVEMRKSKNKGSEFKILAEEVKGRIETIKKLEKSVRTSLKRLKIKAEKTEATQADILKADEAYGYLKDQKIKFYGFGARGGGFTWLENEEKISTFREGLTFFDAEVAETETLSTVVQGDGEQDLEGFSADDLQTPRTQRQPRNIRIIV